MADGFSHNSCKMKVKLCYFGSNRISVLKAELRGFRWRIGGGPILISAPVKTGGRYTISSTSQAEGLNGEVGRSGGRAKSVGLDG